MVFHLHHILATVPLSITLSGSMKERGMNHSYVAGTRQDILIGQIKLL